MSGSGDHVDEAVEDDSTRVASLHALEECISLLGNGSVIVDLDSTVVHLHGSDEVLFIPSLPIAGGDSVVGILPSLGTRFEILFGLEVVAGVAVELRCTPVGEEEVDDIVIPVRAVSLLM